MLRRSDGTPESGRLIYRDDEYGFSVEPWPAGGATSLLVNDVQIEIDYDGKLLYVWGLCAKDSWKRTTLHPPSATPGRLIYVEDIVPGVSRRLNDGRWDVLYDPLSMWLCIGDASANEEAVVFAPDSLAVLKECQLVALWLHPELRS